jgi:beta-phosphoglucomutase
MKWTLEDSTLDEKTIDKLANSYLSGNGHLGLRATLDEHTKDQKTGLLVNGLYDQVAGKWREPVNAPHPMNFRVKFDGVLVAAPGSKSHVQGLDFRYGVQTRTTRFALGGAEVCVTGRRWVSRAHPHLVQAEWTVEADRAVDLELSSGVDGDVWDINGPHLEAFAPVSDGLIIGLSCRTQETKTPVTVVEWVESDFGPGAVVEAALAIGRVWKLKVDPGRVYHLKKLAVVDNVAALQTLVARGFEALEADHRSSWDAVWAAADVVIEGDDEAQKALRHSLYHLITTSPAFPSQGRPGLSIPARGVSGQVYKGAVFWDTEIFMVPFLLNALPETARSLLHYRVETLKGALHKAQEEGYLGAFYAWESQDGGREACTLFNVNDVFTGRPLRTFFRDKQIHISADVALALWDYFQVTGDRTLLETGGADVIFECARFFLSWMVWRPDRNRFELLDVTGPDEYHERVDNDYWTNFTALKTLEAARAVAHEFGASAGRTTLLTRLDGVIEKFYLPQPDPTTGVIPQFDGYHRLEDATPAVLKTRMKHPHEYWGCGDGLARWTQVIKQADVVLALALYPGDHTEAVRRANWEFYEPRTEHGSSLSASAYAIAAARLGKTDFAYRYFLKTATVDMTGDSKQYVGDLYIGGTHPAANGGAWMAVVHGFLGLERSGHTLSLDPHLPQGWTEVRLALGVGGETLDAAVTLDTITLTPHRPFEKPLTVTVGGRSVAWWGARPLVLPVGPTVLPVPMKAALFDLDGVLVDTAKYHFLAWRKLANSMGFDFTEHDNEQLKGVSRTESLVLILKLGGVTRTAEEQAALCELKNQWYVEMIGGMDPSELLPGVVDYLEALRARGVKIALGSASKNAGMILEKTGITRYFDAIVDGTKVSRSKPDPEVFLRGAQELGVAEVDCVVFEDSRAGLQASRAGGMASVGIGRAADLPEADVVVAGVACLL